MTEIDIKALCSAMDITFTAGYKAAKALEKEWRLQELVDRLIAKFGPGPVNCPPVM